MTISKIAYLKILGAILGATLGFVYWYFVGCEDGCTIQSVWWRMSLWGLIMGFLTTGIIIDFLKKQK